MKGDYPDTEPINESVKRVAVMVTPGYCNVSARDKEHLVRVLAALKASMAKCNYLIDTNRENVERIAEIEVELANLRHDSERLDWLSDGKVDNPEDIDEIVNGHRFQGKYLGSMRNAIDAAISAQIAKSRTFVVEYACGIVASGPTALPKECPVHSNCVAIKGRPGVNAR